MIWFLKFRRRPNRINPRQIFFRTPGQKPQKAVSWSSIEQGAALRSPGLSICIIHASENLMHAMLSLKCIPDCIDAWHVYHSSSVHDQNRSECPKTPLTWKSYRSASSSVVVRFSLLSSWYLWYSWFLIVLFYWCWSLFLIRYWEQMQVLLFCVLIIWEQMQDLLIVVINFWEQMQDLLLIIISSCLYSIGDGRHRIVHPCVGWWSMNSCGADQKTHGEVIQGLEWSRFMSVRLPEWFWFLYLCFV